MQTEHMSIAPRVTNYLLSPSHPDGRGKAAFFMRFGFRVEAWETLAGALREVGSSNPVVNRVESSHGTRYTVDGPMRAPDGRAPMVRTVWIVESGSSPRLVTAHPL
jgi:uncharacterized protein DUF6883